MKYIKLNNIQAKKVAGREGSFNANDPRFIEEDFFIIILTDLLPIAKRYITRLIQSNSVDTIDMENISDKNVDVLKLKAVFEEGETEGNARLAERVTKWDYTTREIKSEL